MKRLFKFQLLVFFCFIAACSTPNSEDSGPVKATKSANIVISGTSLLASGRGAISTNDEGDYVFSTMSIGTSVSVALTLFNSGDVPAENIRAYSLAGPLSYLGGSYPGTGGTCTRKLPSTGSCSIVVSFSPSQMGINTATLQLGYYNGKLTRTFEKIFKGSGYSVPTLTVASPSRGRLSGGVATQISGIQIYTGATVMIGGSSCSVLSYSEPSSLTCIPDAHTAGSVDIVVTNTDGGSATLSSGYVYQPAPTVTSLSPSAGALAGGTSVTVTGTGFVIGAVVDLGGSSCNSPNVLSSTSLTCTTSAHSAGSVTVTVTNTDNQYGSLGTGYTYQAAPTVSSVSPLSGLRGGGEYLTITGTGFLSGATATVGGTNCVQSILSSSTTLVCVAPPGTPGSAVDIVVTNTDTQSGNGSSLYSYTTGEGWTTLTTTNIPNVRTQAAYVWTGSKILIWGGGGDGVAYSNSGESYDPVTNSSTLIETDDAPIGRHFPAYVWNGRYLLIWSGFTGGMTNTGGAYDPVSDSWTGIPTTGAPFGRNKATAVWSGSQMLVWGGSNCTSGHCNEGGIYNPQTSTWTLMTTLNAPNTEPQHPSMVWTGKEALSIYGKYNPQSGGWTQTSTTNRPSDDYGAFWTGDRMIVASSQVKIYNPTSDVWTSATTVGHPSLGSLNSTSAWTGARLIFWTGISNNSAMYDPLANAWSSMTTTNAPPDREYVRTLSIWTGKQFFIWGGLTGIGGSIVETGGLYTPAVSSSSNTWSPTTTTGAPSVRNSSSLSWTGSKIIVWGGDNGGSLNTGGIYDPVTNSWTAMTTMNAPTPSYSHVQAWTGSRLLIWGGTISHNEGRTYDLSSDTWSSISTTGAPSARGAAVGAWAGNRLVVWGGGNDPTLYNDGAIYNPSSDSWSAVSTTGAPSGRVSPASVWTGSKMLVWSGSCQGNNGGVYDPTSNSWSSMTTTNAPIGRDFVALTAQWVGSKMVVWGGRTCGGGLHNTGGLYNPNSNSWLAMTTVHAPSQRYNNSSVWTGRYYVTFGGSTEAGATLFNDGGKYDPETDSWLLVSTTQAPSVRSASRTLWTGSQVFLWGGLNDSQSLNSGGLYTP